MNVWDFRFRLVFVKVYIFVQQNPFTRQLKNTLFPFKIKLITTHSFSPTPLNFSLQQGVLKFNDICVSWSYPKTDLEASFLN